MKIRYIGYALCSLLIAVPASHAVAEEMTGQQKNAAKMAERYLQISGFSKQGLINQLSSKAGSNFEEKDAEIAVNSMDVDWNEQAAQSAKQYMKIMDFSCKGLINQLASKAGSGYTEEEARYGAQKAGACD